MTSAVPTKQLRRKIPKQLETWRKRILQFLFPVESDTWLSVLRLGLGLQVIVYTLSLRDDWNYLLAGTGHGLISRNLAEALLSVESRFVPRLGWLVSLGAYVGLSENAVLSIAWVCLLGTGFSLLAGLFCRSSAILAWFLHLCAAKSGGLLSYGADNFMTVGLFYLMLSPLPDQLSLDYLWRKELCNPQLLGFWRRVLQLHLFLIYCFSVFGGASYRFICASSIFSGDSQNVWGTVGGMARISGAH